MTEAQTYVLVYRILRAACLTHEAALAMMGNWGKESLFDAYRKQGDLSEAAIPSHQYVAAVTSGAISRDQFAQDQIGFGLAQWTYYNPETGRGRKLNLYDFWKKSGKTLDDPGMQTDFAIWELQHEYPAVYAELKKSTNLYYCTDLICKRYEQPAFNNVNDRYKAALEIGAALAKSETQEQIEEDKPETPFWPPRMLCVGMTGADVTLLQALLLCHDYNCGGCTGIFNNATKIKVLSFQAENGLDTDGVAGPKTWAALLLRAQ